MSSELVRQALEFVDPEESVVKGKKRRARQPRRAGAPGQDSVNPYIRNRKPAPKGSSSTVNKAEENIKKLLALSSPAVDNTLAEKIVERAIKGKPLAEKIEVKTDEGKSILFPEESFEDFEEELFCS